MKAAERRARLKTILENSGTPVSGSALARSLSVSRQVIVTDVALLRAEGVEITSTNQGYIILGEHLARRVFKVHHSREECEEELNLFVDCGAVVKDVFVSHRVYGIIRGELNIRSRLDVQAFMESIRSGKSSLLSTTTEGYHYHTLFAPSESALDMIENRLWEMGFLAKTLPYEPEELTENILERRMSAAHDTDSPEDSSGQQNREVKK
ncbi:MAG: transcription repressor NadR [Eubacteriales bacterium]|nr:transcription repressor NadR [Eubacteriales bacterium]